MMHDHGNMQVQFMRDALTQLDVQEMRTPGEVDAILGKKEGTVLVVVNSVCGCAAGNARPAVALAMKHGTLPDVTTTVFAGQDVDATVQARTYFGDLPPSSPSFFLLKDGNVVFTIPRHEIEGREASAIADDLMKAFDTFC